MPKPYSERSQAMRGPRARAGDIKALIAENEQLAASLRTDAETHRTRSLDLSTPSDEAKAARAQAQDCDLDADRMDLDRSELQAIYEAKVESESAAAALRAHAELDAETEALAAEVKDRVPAMFAELVSIFQRLQENERRCDAANKRGAGEWLNHAEGRARGFKGATWGTLGDYVSRLPAIKIPGFFRGDQPWPAPERFGALMASGNIEQQLRHNREAAARREEAEKTRWKNVAITHQRGGMVTGIANRDDPCGCNSGVWFIVQMDDRQIALARAKGLTVELMSLGRHKGAQVHTNVMRRWQAEPPTEAMDVLPPLPNLGQRHLPDVEQIQ